MLSKDFLDEAMIHWLTGRWKVTALFRKKETPRRILFIGEVRGGANTPHLIKFLGGVSRGWVMIRHFASISFSIGLSGPRGFSPHASVCL